MSSLSIGDKLIMNTDITVGGGEVKTGATFNGKPVYRKWVSGTQGTGNEWKTISTGIVNGANAHIVDGWTNGANGNNYPLNFFISTSEWSYAGVSVSGATVYLNHYEGYIIGRTAYVCIEYTKTTD